MSQISILAALKSRQIDTGYADRFASDRYWNVNGGQVCPKWQGLDDVGRGVHVNSYYTKSPGCNSAGERVVVENSQRPQYLVNLDLARGLGVSTPGRAMVQHRRTDAVLPPPVKEGFRLIPKMGGQRKGYASIADLKSK